MKRRVLVADDDRLMVQTLCDILTLHGWSAHGVHSGEQAFRLTDREEFSCVVMDIKMGGEDGFSAMQRIKRRNDTVPVVLMTAYTPDELVADTLRRGGLRQFDESYSADDIVAIIQASYRERGSAILLSQDTSLLISVGNQLTVSGVQPQYSEWSPDFVSCVERYANATTLVTIPSTDSDRSPSTLITEFDAGVWIALSGALPPFAQLDNPSIMRADVFLRKPFPVLHLVEHLDVIAA